MSNDIVIACHGLAKTFDDGRLNLTVFEGIDLELRRGDRVAIVGSSGAGKSTLLHILGGLDSPIPFSPILEKQFMAKSRLREKLDYLLRY